ncbi:MAG: YlbF family regulator [Atopococcus tabaci]|uniref:UPF0342 protein Q4F26_02570 n=1 Tax=Atopococcus tabaci TaxID=269774 RepID=A0AA43ZSF9_9LACT|nr:YlbF family regulator [Atopococcus tabaci]
MAEQVNIYDTANQLAKEVTETKEFKDLKEALDQAKADEASNKIYTEFQETQLTIQQQQAAGQEVEQEKIKRLQELSEEMQDDDLLKEVLKNEQEMNMLLNDVNRVVVSPLTKLYL